MSEPPQEPAEPASESNARKSEARAMLVAMALMPGLVVAWRVRGWWRAWHRYGAPRRLLAWICRLRGHRFEVSDGCETCTRCGERWYWPDY